MISNLSLQLSQSQDSFNADWMRSRERYQQAVQQIQQKTDQVKESLTRQVDASLQRIRDRSDLFHTKLSFNVEGATHRVVVRVLDTETDQVIRQFPPESMLRISEEIQKIIGTVVDRLA